MFIAKRHVLLFRRSWIRSSSNTASEIEMHNLELTTKLSLKRCSKT